MFFSSALPLAVLAATSALATPIQQAASLSSSSPPENPQSQNTLKPFVLESLKTSLRDGRQLIMFWVQDPAFGSFSRGTCMAIVDGVDGEQLGPDTDEERQWRPVRPSPEDDAAGPVSGSNGLPFPANEYNMDQDRYEPDSVMGEDGFIDCSNGFSFKTEGDVAFAENGSNQFKLSVKHKLDRENSNGLFRDGEMIFTGTVDVSCKPEAVGSDVWVCNPTGGSPFSFRSSEETVGLEEPLAEDVDAVDNAIVGEDALSGEDFDAVDNDVEGI